GALTAVCPANLVVATAGLVPPALQGHTPDIALRFDPERARDHLARSRLRDGELSVQALDEFEPMISAIARSWRETLGLDVTVRTWTIRDAGRLGPWELGPVDTGGWLPGYPDAEYYLRLLLQSDSKTNEGGFSYAPFDELIERARQERSDRGRPEPVGDRRVHELDPAQHQHRGQPEPQRLTREP